MDFEVIQTLVQILAPPFVIKVSERAWCVSFLIYDMDVCVCVRTFMKCLSMHLLVYHLST